MTCEYDYHHTIYDLATIYDLYVPSVLPRPRMHRHCEHMALGCCHLTGLGFGHTLVVRV